MEVAQASVEFPFQGIALFSCGEASQSDEQPEHVRTLFGKLIERAF
jgi:hypothetical protein